MTREDKSKNRAVVASCILAFLSLPTAAKDVLTLSTHNEAGVISSAPASKDSKATPQQKASDAPALPMHQVDLATGSDEYITSLNGRFVYYMAEKYVTSDVIIQRNVTTGATREVIDGHYVTLVKKGRFAGYLITSRHRYYAGGGSYECVYIVRPDAQEVFPVTDPKAKDPALQKQLSALDDKEAMECGKQ